ncbi:MAG: hypothetical protein ABJB69_06155 [Spartobacteria bacterium]
MSFFFRCCLAALGCLLLAFICSCDKHHLGEAPEVQKEHVDLAHGGGDAPAASPDSSAATTPTPAEFFPEKKP